LIEVHGVTCEQDLYPHVNMNYCLVFLTVSHLE